MWINYSQHQQGNTFRGRNNSLLQEKIYFYLLVCLIFCLSLNYFVIFMHILKPTEFSRNICEIKQLKKEVLLLIFSSPPPSLHFHFMKL